MINKIISADKVKRCPQCGHVEHNLSWKESQKIINKQAEEAQKYYFRRQYGDLQTNNG